MSYVAMDARPVDFILCQYENSKNLFRGPKKSYKGLYGVCLGGADTFGGQVPDPFSSMIERNVGIPILNLGAQHSGAGFYIEDDDILKIIENAHIILIEAPSVVNQSNPYYRAHPRRNDRFVTALAPLYELFPEADFVECHFTNKNYTIVNSVLVGTSERPEVKIDWRIYTKNPDNPLIRDLIIEGLSLVRTQKEEFSSILNSNSGDINSLFKVLEEFIVK